VTALNGPAAPQRPIWAEPQRPRHVGTAVAAAFGIAVAAIALAAVLVYLVGALGAGGVTIAAIAALVPFAIVLAVIRWIDRWEPEPRVALLFAVLWGAGVAVAIALLFDLGVEIAVAATAGTRPDAALQAYARERQARVRRVQDWAERNGHVFHLPRPLRRAAFAVARAGAADLDWLYGYRPPPA